MTILSTIQAFAPKVGLPVPTGAFGQDSQRALEIAAAVNSNVRQLIVRNEWQVLKTIATITGDGTSTAFDLPADYDRMLEESALRSSLYAGPFTHIDDQDAWLDKVIRQFSFVTPAWTIYGGQLHIMPAMPAATTVQFFYISNAIVDRVTGDDASTVVEDLDALKIDEEILKLQMVWTWKAQHSMPYMEDMEVSEDYIEKKISKESGPKAIRTARVRLPHDAALAYPFSIIVP